MSAASELPAEAFAPVTTRGIHSLFGGPNIVAIPGRLDFRPLGQEVAARNDHHLMPAHLTMSV
jgi:hypothetical protein